MLFDVSAYGSNFDLTTFKQTVEELAEIACTFVDGNEMSSTQLFEHELVLRSPLSLADRFWATLQARASRGAPPP